MTLPRNITLVIKIQTDFLLKKSWEKVDSPK
jgi:hypothetical protein